MQGRQNTSLKDDVVIAERRGDALVGRAEDSRHRHAHRRRQVHRARIVRHERRAPRQDAGQLAEIRSSNQVHDGHAGRQR